ncbi:MAG: non-ribosomal peptide synthetase [Candidatus Binatia bacterium]
MDDSPIPSFNLPPEQQRIRDKCLHPSGTFVEFPMADVESSIPARFEQVVRQYPNYTAIKSGDQVVTYAELNALANRVAGVILARSRNDAKPVALLFEKGVEQIAAMIGVLKVGRAFVLLDSSLPNSRLELMLEDFLPDLIVTDRQNIVLANNLGPEDQPAIEIESIDTNAPIDNPYREIAPDALAFIVHTSGSSGRPKGVIYNHTTLLHHVMLRTNADGFCPQDRIPHFSSGTANAITNFFFALLNGAALLPFDVKKEGIRRLSTWLSQEKITVCLIAAPLFRNLCEGLTATDRFPDMRLLRLRSETVCKSDVDLYKRYFSEYSVLANGLSSSETQMLTEYYIDYATKLPGADVPVGYTVQEKEILLLNEQGEPVGYNEIGEIVVRSKHLSPGYWRNPDLTSAKFKYDPARPEERIYHTGDLGLMLPDGCLIHKGRKDFRVKIRGYGVEIGEVEQALRDHSEIQDTVVVAKETESGEARLVAYLTAPVQPRPDIGQIRSMLKTKLPDYMIPSSFVLLDALPLTANGKLDRRALPDPGNTRPDLSNSYAPPSTTTQAQLISIWSEVLSLDQIGVHDSFFDLGGHSLAAFRVVSRVIQTFALELPIKALFDAPTVAEMAAIIVQNQAKRASDEDLAQMLREVEAMTEDEARKQIADAYLRKTTQV